MRIKEPATFLPRLPPVANALRAMRAPVTVTEECDTAWLGRREWTYEVRYRPSASVLSCAQRTIGGADLQSGPPPDVVVDDLLAGLLAKVGIPAELIKNVREIGELLLTRDGLECELIGGYHDGARRTTLPLDPNGYPPPTITAPLSLDSVMSDPAGMPLAGYPSVTYTRDYLSSSRRLWLYRV